MYLFMSKLLALSGGVLPFADEAGDAPKVNEKFSWIYDIVNAIDILLYPLLIVVAAAGTIYAIVLGVNMARADSPEKREEAKKRLINLLVGIAIAIALILFFKLLIKVILPKFFGEGWSSYKDAK